MLALSPATTDGASEFLDTPCGFTINPPEEDDDEFPLEFYNNGDLLDIIDFDGLFDVSGDVLPDLEMDPEILAGDFSNHMNTSSTITTTSSEKADSHEGETNKGISGRSEEVVSKRNDEDQTVVTETVTYDGDTDRSCNRKRKCSFKNNRISNDNVGKRKVKVDWKPELHRRFVETVEELGVDKAVPTRILELMGVHCLTRHNVASHLQKYRSHRKHLLAREAEAANWARKRQIYGSTVDNVKGRNKNGWLAPAAAPSTLGFPPPPPLAVKHHHFKPLHVWGHPALDHSVMPHVWPKHLPPPSTIIPNPPFWIHNGTYPYLPTVTTRFRAPPVTGIPQALPQHMVYKPLDHSFGGARPPPVDLHPSKESVDAAIGDVLTRPWLPLPLGLKPPAVDGVMTELHRHGVSEVPPTSTASFEEA